MSVLAECPTDLTASLPQPHTFEPPTTNIEVGDPTALNLTIKDVDAVLDKCEEYRRGIEERKAGLKLPFSLLKQGLSQLGPRADGLKECFLKLALPNSEISDIRFLENYPFLQAIELAGNSINDVHVLGQLRYLVRLDLSNNHLSRILDFDPPLNLQEVDLSGNHIAQMEDLSRHKFLQRLCLDRNSIKTILGLHRSSCLTHLSIAGNNLERITGLADLPLRFLNLSRNRLKALENIETLTELEELQLDHNEIQSMQGLHPSQHSKLRVIHVDHNQISDFRDIQYACSLPMLQDFSTRGNPISCDTDYRTKMVFKAPQLACLDGLPVPAQEKVAAVNVYAPPVYVIDALVHINKVRQKTKEYATLENV